MQSNIWRPLVGERKIRLAHVSPSKSIEAQPCVLLEEAHIYSDYEAISYAWGDPSDTKPINLNGSQWPVTTNLEAALRYLRNPNEVKIFWMDAICISQYDMEEKSAQILLMKNIFAGASAVRVWLGEAVSGSDEAFDIMDQIATGKTLNDVKLHGEPIQDDHIRALAKLFNRTWWRRIWVLQEYTLASEAFLHCGRRLLNMQFLKQNIRSTLSESGHNLDVTARLLLVNAFVAATEPFRLTRELFADISGLTASEVSKRFHIFLCLVRNFDASDNRDRIYGILGLAPTSLAALIEPDYTKPLSQIYTDATFELMKTSRSLAILSQVEELASPKSIMPSWVPDWTWAPEWKSRSSTKSFAPPKPLVTDTYSTIRFFNDVGRLNQHWCFKACGEHGLSLELVRENKLKLKGAYFSRVAALAPFFGWNPASNTVINMDIHNSDAQTMPGSLLRFFSVDTEERRLMRYVTGATLQEAFLGTLYSNRAHGRDDAQLDCQSEDCRLCRPPSELPTEDGIRNQLSRTGRRMFVANGGYFGTGPAGVKVGDLIYIIAGGLCLYILRPKPGTQDHFTLIGECFVYGIMDGEGVTKISSPWKHFYTEKIGRKLLGLGQPLVVTPNMDVYII